MRNVSRAAVSLLHILYTRSGAVKWQHGCGSKAAVKTAVGDTHLVSKEINCQHMVYIIKGIRI